QLIGQCAIPGDADQRSKVPPQIVHRPLDGIRDVGLVHTELVVFAFGIIMEVWLILEAVEAQELHWLALDVAIDAERWPAIASSDLSIPDVEAEPTYPNCQSLFCHGNVPPRAWIPHTSRLDKPNIAYLQVGVNTFIQCCSRCSASYTCCSRYPTSGRSGWRFRASQRCSAAAANCPRCIWSLPSNRNTSALRGVRSVRRCR